MAKQEFDEDDDFELELEDVDPEIQALARKRAVRQIQETEARAAKLDTFEAPSEADTLTLNDFQGFRFTTKHLLIATAVVAVFMSMVRLGEGCNAIFFSALGMLAFGWWYVLRKERNERLDRERKRKDLDSQLASLRKNDQGEPIASTARTIEIVEDDGDLPPEKPALTFAFSLKQILITFAVAAVILTLASLMGAEQASVLLGIVALVGLAIQVMGFELPGILVFGWWILIVLYVLMSLASMFKG